MKTRIIIDVLIFASVIAIVFIGTLFKNAEPFALDQIFSRQNIIESVILLAVVLVIVIPLHKLILRIKPSNKELNGTKKL
ncbi:MAG: hypothetical protein CVV49_19965 [Spirochaetae bacterium HGW-Spirochaetae-5]|nr:MAG: hypothetical protein CVV49_19965 [Spirochaetae bacterium HGW-Spirochaetae-5]